MDNTLNLIKTLEQTPNSKKILQLIKLAKNQSLVDITKQVDQLIGV